MRTAVEDLIRRAGPMTMDELRAALPGCDGTVREMRIEGRLQEVYGRLGLFEVKGILL